MASIHKDIPIDAPAHEVWDAVRDFGAVHTRLAPGFVLDTRLDGADLLGRRIWIEPGVTLPSRSLARGPRVGIDYAGTWVEKPWRFWIRGNPYVSGRPRASKSAHGG